MVTKRSSKTTTKSGTMTEKKRDSLEGDEFALPKERKEPLNNASHVRNALARFDQVQGVAASEKKPAMARIKKAAKKFGVDIDATTADKDVKKPTKKAAKKASKN